MIHLAGKYGLIDASGHIIVQPDYHQVMDFSEGLAKVETEEKSGFVDRTGRIAIELKYEADCFNCGGFSKGLARVKRGNSEFYIDRQGTEYYKP